MSKSGRGQGPFGTPGAGQGAWGKKSQLDRTCNGREDIVYDGVIRCATTHALRSSNGRIGFDCHFRTRSIGHKATLDFAVREGNADRVRAVLAHDSAPACARASGTYTATNPAVVQCDRRSIQIANDATGIGKRRRREGVKSSLELQICQRRSIEETNYTTANITMIVTTNCAETCHIWTNVCSSTDTSDRIIFRIGYDAANTATELSPNLDLTRVGAIGKGLSGYRVPTTIQRFATATGSHSGNTAEAGPVLGFILTVGSCEIALRFFCINPSSILTTVDGLSTGRCPAADDTTSEYLTALINFQL